MSMSAVTDFKSFLCICEKDEDDVRLYIEAFVCDLFSRHWIVFTNYISVFLEKKTNDGVMMRNYCELELIIPSDGFASTFIFWLKKMTCLS